MLKLFKNLQKGFNDELSTTSCAIEKYNEIQSNSEIKEYKNTIYHPLSTKEWTTTTYSYHKAYTKALVSSDAVLNKLYKSYYNMLEDKIKILFKRRRANKTRYSANKIYASRAELNHTNTDISITLYIYNKQKSSIEQLIRKFLTFIKANNEKKKPNHKKKNPNLKNRVLHILKNNYFIFIKWNVVFFNTINSVLRYLGVNLKGKTHNIPRYIISLLKKLVVLQNTLFTSTNNVNFNGSKSNNLHQRWKNLGINSLIEKLYNKKVEMELVELNNIDLNSDVFSSAVALKLRDRKNKVVRILRKAILQMVRIPDLHTLITFDDNMEAMDKNNIIKTIKQQAVSGVRFEASGRLTRRLTAMRAVFKYRYAGSLKNIRSSFNNVSSTMLRGYVKSNSQYTLINSKTRNGTFGLKGWVSSHNLMLQFIYKTIRSAFLHWMLNQIQLYLTRLSFFLLNKYSALYKVIDYLSTNLSTFYSYIYSIGIKLHNKFKNNFPILYSITLYIYSEYLAIINGDLSRNMEIMIGLYFVFNFSIFNLILYSLLTFNVWLKKHLIKDTWLKENFQILYRVLLDISSLINTIFIFYFLDLIFINLIKPFLLKVWSGILKMASPDKANVDTGGLSNKGNMPNPQKPSGQFVIDSDKDEDKKHKEKLKREFDKFYKANLEFNSADKNPGRDWEVMLKDIYDDYAEYLPEKEKSRILAIMSTKHPKFQLNEEDSVHQFWLNKRESNKHGWDSTLEIIDIFARNSQSIQEQLGGRKHYKSHLFRKETEGFKIMWSAPHKKKESIIRRELEKSRAFDKLLKEKGLSIKELIDRIN
jgi:hypothetical protein